MMVTRLMKMAMIDSSLHIRRKSHPRGGFFVF
jgi:hypothetical protein